ncbi:alpha/beta hydrolase family protein [Shimazuella kribbensis]|uniref:alpha/beta hydrolase family protein n=1 Tax=Shimazuella kribbensis TaxID=139808 RepID=UPI0003FFD2F7|nr:prolyl oligopeptidase family serine peptidase [Shimazuella kribbensis]
MTQRFKFPKGFICFLATMIMVSFLLFTSTQNAEAAPTNSYHEKEIVFESNKTRMHGTVLMPKNDGKHPGIVLLHGSGQKEREKLRQDAEVFVKAGFAALIYDKREKSKARTFQVLSQDAIAAVQVLQSQPNVDPHKVGIWGFSEGAWVAPMAASKSTDISFVVLLGTPVVTPIQQQNFHIQNRLIQNGVTSQSAIDSLINKGARFVYQSGMFPQADHDAEHYLSQVKQPILAVWGAKDRLTPTVEGSQKLMEIWKDNGNKHGSILFVADADHAAHQTDKKGFERLSAFASGYENEVVVWLDQVVKGHPPLSKVIGQEPKQDVKVYQNLIPDVSWYDSLGFQIAVLGALLLGYIVAICNSMFKQKGKKDSPIKGFAGWTIASGFIATLGFAVYFTMIWAKGGKILGPIVWDRPVIWLIIQIFAVLATGLSAMLAVRGMSKNIKTDMFRYILLLVLGATFVIWAWYWGLYGWA